MKPTKARFPRPGQRTGAALVLTLFFILLISAMIVALIFSMQIDRGTTHGYSHKVRVQELANGALEEILSDLNAEIIAGSRPGGNFTVNGKRVYVPTSPQTSQPARIGYDLGTGANGDYALDVDPERLPPTLIRVSRANVDLPLVYPAETYDQTKLPPQRATAVPTTTLSANGRVISGRRWNAPLLMGLEAPTRFTDSPPDWIYYTRAGGRALVNDDLAVAKPSRNLDLETPVLGRYAYVIYDAGGLLDVNVAGYPSTLKDDEDNGGPEAIRAKSSAMYASLEKLPELESRTDALKGFLEWRSKGTLFSAEEHFLTAADEWAEHGFLKVEPGDNPLLSRKDLIDYYTKVIGTKAPLPYLGTFSRSVAAPSARPVTPVGSSILYSDEADDPAAINQDLANARFTTPATVTHYLDDAGTITYPATEGDPLLQSRFSLARLDWLKEGNPETGAAPSAAKAPAIKACFGLVWDTPGGSGPSSMANGGSKCWNYVGANGTLGSPPGVIKTLAEVALEGREPDFFELLKAAILRGSLGKGPGEAAFNNGKNVEGFNKDYYYPWGDDSLKTGTVGMYSHTFGPSSSVPAPARIPDMQIIRIGANIIDQYDEDSYPTAIYFKYQEVANNDPAGGTAGNPILGPVTMAYGTENLPYLQSIRLVLASPERSSSGNPGPGTDLGTNKFAGWRQPYLWNPHQVPDRDFKARPANYEIRAYGSGQTKWQWPGSSATAAGKTYTNGLSYNVDYYTMPGLESPEDIKRGTLNFTLADANSAAAFCFYDKPYPLMQDGLPNVTATSPDSDNLGKPAMAHYDEPMSSPYDMPNHFVGFNTGITPTDPAAPDPYKPFYVSDAGGLSGQGRPELGANTYALGWVDSSGGFHPYSYLTGVFTFEGIKLESADRRVGTANPNRGIESWLMTDPRTERFSLSRGIQAYNLSGTINAYWGNNQSWYPSAKPRVESGFFGTGYPWQSYSYPAGEWMINSATPIGTRTPGHYTDPDGIVRPADGIYATPATGDGLPMFYSNATPTGNPVSLGDKGVESKTKHGRRPVILNRPFQSVAELGYVFRDLPFKTLDFFSGKSADTALLDVFCLNDAASVGPQGLNTVVAGRVNPNSASVPVLTALLQGAAKKEWDPDYNLSAEAAGIAEGLAAEVMREDGFHALDGHRGLAPALVKAMRAAVQTSPDQGNKAYLEAPIRALAESTDFRTWNLMIDVIAQSGRMAENAKTFNSFIVQSEYRVWLHVAIDRYTGKIIAREMEPIYE